MGAVQELCRQGEAELRNRNFAAAEGIYQQARELDANCIEALEGLATAAFAQDDCDRAIELYRVLVSLEPLVGRHLVNLGALLNRTGEYLQASEVLRKAIQRDKRCAEGFYNLGIAYRKLKQYALAVSAYKEAIRVNSQMPEAYQNLGNVYLEMGNVQLAISNFRKALEIKPNFERARQGLQKAEEQVQRDKQSHSPFGRLVKTEALQDREVRTNDRPMTTMERWNDRKEVLGLSSSIHAAALNCLQHLQKEVEPRLHALQCEVADGNNPLETARLSREFRAAVEHWSNLRKQLKRYILELRAHEELLRTADMSLE